MSATIDPSKGIGQEMNSSREFSKYSRLKYQLGPSISSTILLLNCPHIRVWFSELVTTRTHRTPKLLSVTRKLSINGDIDRQYFSYKDGDLGLKPVMMSYGVQIVTLKQPPGAEKRGH